MPHVRVCVHMYAGSGRGPRGVGDLRTGSKRAAGEEHFQVLFQRTGAHANKKQKRKCVTCNETTASCIPTRTHSSTTAHSTSRSRVVLFATYTHTVPSPRVAGHRARDAGGCRMLPAGEPQVKRSCSATYQRPKGKTLPARRLFSRARFSHAAWHHHTKALSSAEVPEQKCLGLDDASCQHAGHAPCAPRTWPSRAAKICFCSCGAASTCVRRAASSLSPLLS
jgi:hypothetical protein